MCHSERDAGAAHAVNGSSESTPPAIETARLVRQSRRSCGGRSPFGGGVRKTCKPMEPAGCAGPGLWPDPEKPAWQARDTANQSDGSTAPAPAEIAARSNRRSMMNAVIAPQISPARISALLIRPLAKKRQAAFVLAQSWQATGRLSPMAPPIRSSSLRGRLFRRSSAKRQPASSRSNYAPVAASISTAPLPSTRIHWRPGTSLPG